MHLLQLLARQIVKPLHIPVDDLLQKAVTGRVRRDARILYVEFGRREAPLRAQDDNSNIFGLIPNRVGDKAHDGEDAGRHAQGLLRHIAPYQREATAFASPVRRLKMKSASVAMK